MFIYMCAAICFVKSYGERAQLLFTHSCNKQYSRASNAVVTTIADSSTTCKHRLDQIYLYRYVCMYLQNTPPFYFLYTSIYVYVYM